MAVLFVGLVGLAISNIDTAELLGRTGDLTGRGEVWRQTWKLIMDKPLTGYGYGALWFPNDATLWIQQSLTDFSWIVYHAHNGFLQVASEIGLPLSCVALLMVAQQLVEIFYCQYERQQVGVLFVLAFVLAYLISNFSEARFLVNRELYWILFLALPISMLRQITVQSDDPVGAEEDADHFEPAVVPGKPWLRPAGRQHTPGGLGSAFASAAALQSLGPEDDREHIDLGDGHDESADFTDFKLQPDDEQIPSESSAQFDSPVDDEDSFDQTVYDEHDLVDRYDKPIDETGDWVDLPIDPHDDSINDAGGKR